MKIILFPLFVLGALILNTLVFIAGENHPFDHNPLPEIAGDLREYWK